MSEKRRVRPRIGDVIRVRVPDGRAADAQFTHKNPKFGCLLRVLGPAPNTSVPCGDDDAAAIAVRPTQFVTFFPLGAACARGIALIIGRAPVPAEAQRFPVFRARAFPGADLWLWDGEKEWRVSSPPAGYRAMPLREIVNDTLLVERAHAGWGAAQEE